MLFPARKNQGPIFKGFSDLQQIIDANSVIEVGRVIIFPVFPEGMLVAEVCARCYGPAKSIMQLAFIVQVKFTGDLAKVIQTLKEEGVYENTLIFYFSDNGGARVNSSVNLPFRDYKQSVYEGGLRVPFVISWPEKLAPARCDEPVISIDILPTICAVLGISLPEDRIYDGRNIMSAIDGNSDAPLHEQLFFDGDDNAWAVREGEWKLLFSRKGKQLELYNLDKDAEEQHNLVEEYPDIAADLKEKYTGWRGEKGIPMGEKKN